MRWTGRGETRAKLRGETDAPRGTKRTTRADQLKATSCFVNLVCSGEPMARARAGHLRQLANCRRLHQSLVPGCRITPHAGGLSSAGACLRMTTTVFLFGRVQHRTSTVARPLLFLNGNCGCPRSAALSSQIPTSPPCNSQNHPFQLALRGV